MDTIGLVKAIADPRRLKILSLLAKKELCVCELEGIVGLSQPLASAHLKKLKTLGALKERPAGKWVYFSIREDFWKREKPWLSLLLDRISKESGKEAGLFRLCLKRRRDGKCVTRFQPMKKEFHDSPIRK
ncbi:MAG: winged helix-turn-helix transcriptional regulator [Elusimicrobia bacterium]|jgi:ArsR family transcriptional regulator|nr:winged helix-turn-helix transcriptional regulator [Elusimicrobiota bacterium]MBL0058417.1 winged helix-turn-helix transcriptional regulator [Elusimicrobiota bacterium]